MNCLASSLLSLQAPVLLFCIAESFLENRVQEEVQKLTSVVIPIGG